MGPLLCPRLRFGRVRDALLEPPVEMQLFISFLEKKSEPQLTVCLKDSPIPGLCCSLQDGHFFLAKNCTRFGFVLSHR